MDTKQQVREFITKNFYAAASGGLTDEASLLTLGIIDSTGVLEVIGFIEEQFGVTVDDHEMVPENLDSITQIAAFVDRKRPAA